MLTVVRGTRWFVALVMLGPAACTSESPVSADGTPVGNRHGPVDVECVWGNRFSPSGEAPDCTCTSSGGEGDTFEYSGASCRPSFDELDFPPLYCADADYPRSGSCSYWSAGTWRCSRVFRSCACSFSAEHIESAWLSRTCDALPESDGTPWRCCAHDADCSCRPGSDACPDDWREVTSCTSYKDLGLRPPPGSCPDGQAEVRDCNIVDPNAPPTGCRGSYDCPSNCDDAGDAICCSICAAGGKCVTSCCSEVGCF